MRARSLLSRLPWLENTRRIASIVASRSSRGVNSSRASAGCGLAPRPPATNTRKPASRVPSSSGAGGGDHADVVEHRLAAVGLAAGEVDLELAGQALGERVVEEVLEGGLGPRADVEDLVGAGAGEVAAHDVADGVAARLAGGEPDGGQVAQDGRDLLEVDEVELHVLPGGEVAPAAAVGLGDVGEHVELLGGDGAVGHLHPHHLVVAALALAVDAVVQPEDAEGVLLEVAGEVPGELLLELLDVGTDLGIDLTLQHGARSRES